jgi:N-acetyltransferase
MRAMMQRLSPLVLTGRRVRLEPLATSHVEAMLAAASVSRVNYAVAFVPATLDAMAAYVQLALDDQAAGTALPFVTVDVRTQRIVGATWLAHDAQRTALNTEAKLLMLSHAFEQWGVHRVTIKTDVRNARSRAAIERLGARLDGVLRGHSPSATGTVRDTACYSIVNAEWSAVRAGLEARLALFESLEAERGSG